MTAADQVYWQGYWAHWAVHTFGASAGSLCTRADASMAPSWRQGWADYAHQRGEENDR